MQPSHLNWPLTSGPVSVLDVGLYRATSASIFHSSSINGSAASPYSKLHDIGLYTHLRACVGFFPFLQTLFAPFLKCIRTPLIVLYARLLKRLIAFQYLFVLRLNFSGNKLHLSSLVSSYDGGFSRERYATGLHQIGEYCWSDVV